MIRQDWLDNLGLDMPETFEEFKEVMRAFTEDDPDGNGVDDTYGFVSSYQGPYNREWNGLEFWLWPWVLPMNGDMRTVRWFRISRRISGLQC